MKSTKIAKRLVEKAPVSSRAKVVKLREAVGGALGPGAHFAKLFKKVADGRYEARLFGGERFEVAVAPEMDWALTDRCLAEQDVVLVGMLGGEIVVFGALRTKESTPDELVLTSPRRVVIQAGKSKLELCADGKVKLSADGVTVDAPREIRLASAHVEIP